jgi:hypothetical protein
VKDILGGVFLLGNWAFMLQPFMKADGATYICHVLIIATLQWGGGGDTLLTKTRLSNDPCTVRSDPVKWMHSHSLALPVKLFFFFFSASINYAKMCAHWLIA